MAEYRQGDRVVKMSGVCAGKYGTVNSVREDGTLNVTFDGERLPRFCDPERCGKVAANAAKPVGVYRGCKISVADHSPDDVTRPGKTYIVEDADGVSVGGFVTSDAAKRWCDQHPSRCANSRAANAATPTGADIARFWNLAKAYHDGRISASQSHELNVLEDKFLWDVTDVNPRTTSWSGNPPKVSKSPWAHESWSVWKNAARNAVARNGVPWTGEEKRALGSAYHPNGGFVRWGRQSVEFIHSGFGKYFVYKDGDGQYSISFTPTDPYEKGWMKRASSIDEANRIMGTW